MSKAASLLNDLKIYNVHEYDAPQKYMVVKYSERDLKGVKPLFSGEFSECNDYVQSQKNPDYVIIDATGRMFPISGTADGETTPNNPQTAVVFDVAPLDAV